ncbi:MAG: amino acid dehydrogenase, partial [Alphaproteobacteria bacterium]|nr:amino acid dehydrogenase [Alphaproteobacteria bacterium]
MAVFDLADFDAHEQVVFAADADSGLRGILAIHDAGRGPALGGCRIWHYGDDAEAVRDALRLSRGMTYKAAVADLPLGGGKSVILADTPDLAAAKTPARLRALGRAVDRLGGRYVIAEDVGTSPEDMAIVAGETDHVVGLAPERGGRGDPSPVTARGVFEGLKAAVAWRLGDGDLAGRLVAVQGLGHVGWHLCDRLHRAGARLVVADLDD